MSRTVRPEVATFVAQVRACLSDLSPEEVEELTGGLDADLEERLEDSGPGTAPPDLGDPAAYAAELRAAAGLPPRGAGGGRRAAGPGLLTRVRTAVAREATPLVEALQRQPWWPQFRESVVALRPAWWLARAWVAWWLLVDVTTGSSHLLPGGFGPFVLLALAVGISVALGRGLLDRRLRLDRSWAPVLLRTLNVVAAVLLLPALSSVGPRVETVYDSSMGPQVQGLSLDGVPVRNVYAYDAQGRPIPLVQLYDQNGRPLDVRHDPYTDPFEQQAYTDVEGQPVAPFVDDRSRNRWNVFPLPAASYPEPLWGEDGTPTATASSVVTQPAPPLVAVPPITGILGVPSSSPGAPTTDGAGPTGTSATDGPTGPDAPGGTSSAPSASATTGPSSTRTTSPRGSGSGAPSSTRT